MRRDFHIFIVVAEDCAPCHRFHQEEYPELETEFGTNKISLIPIKARGLLVNPAFVDNFQASKTDPNKHPQVVNVRWTPAIAVVTKESWDNKDDVLEGYVYGGELTVNNKNNVFTRDKNQKFLITAGAIIEWIYDKTETSPIFNDNKNYKQITTSPKLELFGQSLKFRSRDVVQD